MLRILPGSMAVALLIVLPAVAAAQYTIKEADSPPPKEINDSIRKLLNERSVQLRDAKDAVLCELWFRKEVPGKATAQQVKNGLTYREIPETTLLAVIRIAEAMTEYRKQKMKPGLYTLRLAFQPQDGDHMGTAPHAEFCVAVPVAEDKGVAAMEPKVLNELSTKGTGTAHPGVFLLFPQTKPEAAPQLLKKEDGHWAVTNRLEVMVNGQKAVLGIVLNLIGVSSAA